MSLPQEFWQTIWPALAAIAAAVQTLIIIFALIYAVLQTRELRNQIKLSQVMSASDLYHRMNETMLQHEDLAKEVGQDSKSAFATQVFNAFLTTFRLRKDHLVSEDQWKGDVLQITDYMKYDLIKNYWIASRLYYPADFRTIVDCILPEDLRPKDAERPKG